MVEDEDEDDQEETEVGWLGERQGVKKVQAREMEGEGRRDKLKEKERGRGRTRSGPRVGDVQYCSNDAEAAPLATIFSLYLLGIHLVLYSGLLHFIPASLPCPLSVSHFLSLLVSLPRCALAPFARMAYWDQDEKEKNPSRLSAKFEDQDISFFFLIARRIISETSRIGLIKKFTFSPDFIFFPFACAYVIYKYTYVHTHAHVYIYIYICYTSTIS